MYIAQNTWMYILAKLGFVLLLQWMLQINILDVRITTNWFKLVKKSNETTECDFE